MKKNIKLFQAMSIVCYSWWIFFIIENIHFLKVHILLKYIYMINLVHMYKTMISRGIFLMKKMIWNQQVVAYLSCHLKAWKEEEEEEMHSKWTCETFSFLTFWSTQALHNPHMSSEIIIQITQPVKSMKDFNTSTLTCFHPKKKIVSMF
jgi:hypothetical protein